MVSGLGCLLVLAMVSGLGGLLVLAMVSDLGSLLVLAMVLSLGDLLGLKRPPKMPIAKMEKKISAPAARNLPTSARKELPSKMHSSDSRQHLELKKGSQERCKDKTMPQRPVISSKPQVNKPVKQVSSHSRTTLNVQRPKKKQLSEDEKALMMIRNMSRAKVAKEEDGEQLKLIEEEQRMRRLAKKHKLTSSASTDCIQDSQCGQD
ncbi:hypothetical protein CRYUN_Cryun15aG0105100 [Craigia yunnanensis]